MKGIIIINPFMFPSNCLYQANRLKEEFSKLNIEVEIFPTAFIKNHLINGKLQLDLTCDFAIFLDKDKYLSSSLEKNGIRLFNNHEAIRICDDKGETYIALANSGLNLPDTYFGALCYNKDLMYPNEIKQEIISKLGFPLVIKQSYGSMGNNVYLVKNLEEFNKTLEIVKCKPHLFQKYLSKEKGKDIRAIVIGGKVVASMERYNKNDFRSNVAQGGIGTKIQLNEEYKECAERCAKILNLDYCGVDILYGDNGKPVVCEVNSNAFMEGIENATKINIAGLYAEYIVKTMKK